MKITRRSPPAVICDDENRPQIVDLSERRLVSPPNDFSAPEQRKNEAVTVLKLSTEKVLTPRAETTISGRKAASGKRAKDDNYGSQFSLFFAPENAASSSHQIHLIAENETENQTVDSAAGDQFISGISEPNLIEPREQLPPEFTELGEAEIDSLLDNLGAFLDS